MDVPLSKLKIRHQNKFIEVSIIEISQFYQPQLKCYAVCNRRKNLDATSGCDGWQNLPALGGDRVKVSI